MRAEGVPASLLWVAATVVATIPDVHVRRVRSRFGESLSELADRYATTSSELLSLSGLSAEYRVTAGTELFVPDHDPSADRHNQHPFVMVSQVTPPAGNNRRIFYRSGTGDSLGEVAGALGVTRDNLIAWNTLDPNSILPSGLWLQAWIEHDPVNALVHDTTQVELAERGTDSASERVAAADGRVRMVVTVHHGDSMTTEASRYGLTRCALCSDPNVEIAFRPNSSLASRWSTDASRKFGRSANASAELGETSYHRGRKTMTEY